MSDKRDILPRDEEGELHGYCECYYPDGGLYIIGNFMHGKRDGYWEVYNFNGNIRYKGNYINGKHVWYWETYYDNNFIKEYYII